MSPTEQQRATELLQRLYPEHSVRWALDGAEFEKLTVEARPSVFAESSATASIGMFSATVSAYTPAMPNQQVLSQQQAQNQYNAWLGAAAAVIGGGVGSLGMSPRREPMMMLGMPVTRMSGYRFMGVTHFSSLLLMQDWKTVDELNSLGVWGVTALKSGIVVAINKPTDIKFDDRARPHNPDGPSVTWGTPDFMEGFDWHLHGIRVPKDAILHPETIPILVLKEHNSEVRRVLAEHYGTEKLMREIGKIQHQDETGKLWRLDLVEMAMVEVKNSTPEPDGSYRIYFLKVPPNTRTAREGVAWTFWLTERDYQPEVQT
jgi:hypothetical protein